MTHKPASRKHSFATIFLIEMWERFGFYGMAALLVLFLIQRYGFSDEQATLTWGAFSALVYATPAIGGWIGDKVLGARRSMILGAIVLGFGYLLLAMPDDQMRYVYASLGVIVVGNGLFKANAGNLVRQIYEGDEAQIDSAFTLYYMAVNIGGAASMLATPWIKDHWGWHAAFAVCCSGLLLGLVNFFVMFRSVTHIGSAPDAQPIHWGKLAAVVLGGIAIAAATTYVLQHKEVAVACVYAAGIAIVAIVGRMVVKCDRSERPGMLTAVVLIAQTILFFVFYQQLSTSLTLFALRNVDLQLSLFGVHLFTWNPAQFQALNSIWIMVLGPILAALYSWLAKREQDVDVASKFALGFVAVAAGFFVFAFSRHFALNGLVSSWFMVTGYGLYSLGELLVSGLGLAMIARYVPGRMAGFMMGAYYVALGISQYLGSVIANFAKMPSGNLTALDSLPVYTKLFADLGWLAAGGALVAVLLLPFMRKLENARQGFARQPVQGMAVAE